MNIDIFAVCRSAEVRDSALSVLGTFDTIETPGTPLVTGPFSLAWQVRFEPADGIEHVVGLRATNSDGGNILPPMRAEISMHYRDGHFWAVSQWVQQIQRITFPKDGLYSFRLEIDDAEVAVHPLHIRIVEGATHPPKGRRQRR